MGIRNTSYYGWQTAYLPPELSSSTNPFPRVLSQFNDVVVDFSGNVYVAGYEQRQSGFGSYLGSNNSWIVKKFFPKTNTFQDVDFLPNGTANAICVDPNNNIYVCGYSVSASNQYWTVRASSTGQSGSFVNVDFISASFLAGSTAQSIYINPILNASGTYDLYVGGNFINSNTVFQQLTLRKSSTPFITGTFFTVDSSPGIAFSSPAVNNSGIVSDTLGAIYVCSYFSTGSVNNWQVRSSSLGASGTFATIDSLTNAGANCMAIDVNNNLYVGGFSGSSSAITSFTVRKSSTRGSASFTTIDGYKYNPGSSVESCLGISVDSTPLNVVYAAGTGRNPALGSDLLLVRTGVTGSSGSFVNVDIVALTTYFLNVSSITVDKNNNVYTCGETPNSFGRGFIRYGKLTSNSASLGSRMLATSLGYVTQEVSGAIYSNYSLNNVSEFSHGSGLFQMKNVILGTTDKGTVGRDNNAIVQVTHVGSTVQIMWPSQIGQFTNIAGYGDLSPGQSAGSLTTAFVPGDPITITGSFDQVSLFCYLTKQISGTLENIAIKVEKRPLGGVPFATAEQVMTLVPSGSFATQGQLTDLIYTKQIDYGDLSISQIGWPIDIDLTNTRDVRISARQMNGQPLLNTNLIIYGRFIKKFEGEV